MANTILHKRGTTTPAAGSLVTGELAINTATGAVFTKTDSGTVVNIGSGGGASWGTVSGTLSDQTDLQSALDLKASLAGSTFTGKINTPAATTASAFLNLPHGAAPSTPLNGDVWSTTSGLVARINGGNRTMAQREGANTYTSGAKQTVVASATTAGLNISPVAGNPSTPANGDVWHNSTTFQMLARVNGKTEQLNAVKAWVNFNGTGTVAIRASFNVTSITDNAVGNYTVNFTTAMADANYSAVISSSYELTGTANPMSYNTARSYLTSSVTVFTMNSGAGGLDYPIVSVAIFR